MLALHAEGKNVPAIDDCPELPPELLSAWNDFVALGSCRPSGFGIAPIPVTAMLEYLDRRGIDRSLWDERIELWQELDAVVLEHAASKLPKDKADKDSLGA